MCAIRARNRRRARARRAGADPAPSPRRRQTNEACPLQCAAIRAGRWLSRFPPSLYSKRQDRSSNGCLTAACRFCNLSIHSNCVRRRAMKRRIEKAVVLGAGTMGSRIAAHFANAGLPLQSCWTSCRRICRPGLRPRSATRLCARDWKRRKNRSLRHFLERRLRKKIAIGNFEDDLARCAEADDHRSGRGKSGNQKELAGARGAVSKARRDSYHEYLGIAGLSDRRGHERRIPAALGGTHFFNPPRYLKLVEVIPGPKTSSDVVEALSDFCRQKARQRRGDREGHTDFIANRIGTFSMLNALRLMGALE